MAEFHQIRLDWIATVWVQCNADVFGSDRTESGSGLGSGSIQPCFITGTAHFPYEKYWLSKFVEEGLKF